MTDRDLLDDDGENQAVRTFLQLYGGANAPCIGRMREHLRMSGWDGLWPDWAGEAHPEAHLTKGGAQSWLRYLFSLEQAASANPPSQMLTVEQMESLIVEQAARIFELENAASAAPAQEPEPELTGWLAELVRYHPNTLQTLWADGRPVGKWIVERMIARTEQRPAIGATHPA